MQRSAVHSQAHALAVVGDRRGPPELLLDLEAERVERAGLAVHEEQPLRARAGGEPLDQLALIGVGGQAADVGTLLVNLVL